MVYFIQSFIVCIYRINRKELVFRDIFTFDILNYKLLEYLNVELYRVTSGWCNAGQWPVGGATIKPSQKDVKPDPHRNSLDPLLPLLHYSLRGRSRKRAAAPLRSVLSRSRIFSLCFSAVGSPGSGVFFRRHWTTDLCLLGQTDPAGRPASVGLCSFFICRGGKNRRRPTIRA